MERHKWIRMLKEQLQRAQDRMKKYADMKRSERTFKVGDWVYVKLQPYRQISVQGKTNPKLAPRFYGPFEITAKRGTVAYELKLPQGSMVHPVFHVSQLKGKIGDGHAINPNMPLTHPLQQSIEEPEGILGRRLIKRKNEHVAQILIKWVNRDVEEASWEDYDEIKNRFPAFILRDKDNSEREGVSAYAQLRLGAIESFDLVNTEEEEGKEAGQYGLNVFDSTLCMSTGTQEMGRSVSELGQKRDEALKMGPGERDVNEANRVKGALSNNS